MTTTANRADIEILARMLITDRSAYVVRIGWGGSRTVLTEPMPSRDAYKRAAEYFNATDYDPNRATIEVVTVQDVELLYQQGMALLSREGQDAVDVRSDEMIAEARAADGFWMDPR